MYELAIYLLKNFDHIEKNDLPNGLINPRGYVLVFLPGLLEIEQMHQMITNDETDRLVSPFFFFFCFAFHICLHFKVDKLTLTWIDSTSISLTTFYVAKFSLMFYIFNRELKDITCLFSLSIYLRLWKIFQFKFQVSVFFALCLKERILQKIRHHLMYLVRMISVESVLFYNSFSIQK